MRQVLFVVALILPLGLLAADDPVQATGPLFPIISTSAVADRTSSVVSLKNVPAESAAAAIKNFLQAKRDLARLQGGSGRSAEIRIVPDASTNSLSISAEQPDFDEIAALIEQIDQPRDEIMILSVVRLTGLDGKTRVVSRPQIRTLDGQKAAVRIELPDGSQVEVEMTPRFIRGDKSK